MDAITPDHEPLRACRAYQLCHEGQALPHQVHAEVDLGKLQEAVVGADAEVECERDAPTPTHRSAVPCRNRDLVHCAERADHAFAVAGAATTEHERFTLAW